MTQKDPHIERTTKPTLTSIPHEVIDMAKKNIDSLLEAQREFVHALEDMNHGWFDRAKAEMELASEFAVKLTAVRTVPDATTTCQEWTNRQMELLAEDGRQMIAGGQKFMQAGTRIFANGSYRAEN